MNTLSRALLVLSLMMLSYTPAAAQVPVAPVTAPLDPCAAMSHMDLSRLAGGAAPTKILTARIEQASSPSDEDRSRLFTESRFMSAPAPRAEIPANCLLQGYINPHIQFEMRLPASGQWNGKLLYVACNGFCGRVDRFSVIAGLMRNYATITTDGGHYSGASFDAIWAIDNMQARMDFGYRANHRGAVAAKSLIEIYYGRAPKYSYITGCSKGGQAGVMAAQRYPDDFDGVIARGPTIDYSGVNILHCAKNARAVYNRDGSINIDVSKYQLIRDAVIKHCDPVDGLKDGLISNPLGCDFDASMLACKGGREDASCLNPAEVAAVRQIHGPVRDGSGNIIYPATSFGTEPGWDKWILPQNADHKVMSYRAAEGYLRHVAFEQAPGPDYNWYDFNWERDRDKLIAVSNLVDVKSPDFSAFRDAGGKMIVVHGWSDEAIPATASIKWYEGVSAFMGGRDKVAEFARLYLLPGVLHCGSDGPGPSTFDALAALEDWVERGIAPRSLMTMQETPDGATGRTRPAYAYPIEARYVGRGSIEEAHNFSPYDPRGR